MVWDTFYTIVSLVVSLVSVLLRAILGLITMLLALTRIDRCPSPAWFQRLLDLDTVSIQHVPSFSLPLYTHSLSLVLVVMIKSKEL